MKPKIIINNKEVTNLNEVPEVLQGVVEDKNNDGVPDMLEGLLKMAGKGGMLNQVLFNIMGQSDLSNLTPEQKNKLQEKLASFSKFTGGNTQLQSLITGLMGHQSGNTFPSVTVTKNTNQKNIQIPQEQTEGIHSPKSVMEHDIKKQNERFMPKNSQNRYFQSGPLNPIGSSNNGLITEAKAKGVKPMFFLAVALILSWGIYQLAQNGTLERWIDMLEKL